MALVSQIGPRFGFPLVHARIRVVGGATDPRRDAELGFVQAAAQAFRQWLLDEPDNPKARHHLAACTGENVPARAPDDYVETSFDQYADYFDSDLQRLEYRAPNLVAQALAQSGSTGAVTGTVRDQTGAVVPQA